RPRTSGVWHGRRQVDEAVRSSEVVVRGGRLGLRHRELARRRLGKREPWHHAIRRGQAEGLVRDLVCPPVDDPPAVDLLERLHDVYVAAEDQIDIGRGEQLARDRQLLLIRGVLVFRTPVQAHDDDRSAGGLRTRRRRENLRNVDEVREPWLVGR